MDPLYQSSEAPEAGSVENISSVKDKVDTDMDVSGLITQKRYSIPSAPASDTFISLYLVLDSVSFTLFSMLKLTQVSPTHCFVIGPSNPCHFPLSLFAQCNLELTFLRSTLSILIY